MIKYSAKVSVLSFVRDKLRRLLDLRRGEGTLALTLSSEFQFPDLPLLLAVDRSSTFRIFLRIVPPHFGGGIRAQVQNQVLKEIRSRA